MRHADRDRSGGDEATALPTPPRTLGVLAVVLLAVVGTAALPAGRALVVADADSGERLLAAPVDDGTTVTIAYTHSVERTPVRDVYVVEDRRLVMTEMRFQSYGWGLPARADVTLEDGWFVARPDWQGRTLHVTPGRIAKHRLVVGDRSYDLVALSGAETVRISVADRTVLDRLLAALGGGRAAGASAAPQTTEPDGLTASSHGT